MLPCGRVPGLQALQHLEVQCPQLQTEASVADFAQWGFAHAPTLEELYANLASKKAGHLQDEEEPEGYFAALHASRAFASPYCVDAMARAYGLSDLLSGLSGTLVSPDPVPASGSDAAIQQIREAINCAWSDEALRRGVEAAKSGKARQLKVCRWMPTYMSSWMQDSGGCRLAHAPFAGHCGPCIAEH